MKNKNNKGFTLIELLVVIAIIAILSTVVMAGLNSARLKGRDAKRLSDIKSVQAALELFFDTCSGYPSRPLGPVLTDGTAPATGLGGGTVTVGTGACGTTFGTFMNPLPANPGPGGTVYQYCGADSATALPAATVAVAAGQCVAAGAGAYRVGFSLEGASGSLATGNHTAHPGGVI